MAEVTNRTLAILLVCAIMISLAGTIVSLGRLKNIYAPITGFGVSSSDEGRVVYNVSLNSQIEFDDKKINFGDGYAAGGSCTMSINASVGAVLRTDSAECNEQWGTFASGSEYPLVIENYGNMDLNVSITSDKSAATFIGGSSPGFFWMAGQNETGSCNDTTFEDLNNWEAIAANDETPLCSNLTWSLDDATNSIALGIKVVIPENANARTTQQNATITVVGVAITT
jgi:hypothetical protein